MKNQSSLFTRWYQELRGFNFTVVHKKRKENSQSAHMAEAPLLEEDKYAELYKTDDSVIKFEGRVNEIQCVQYNPARGR